MGSGAGCFRSIATSYSEGKDLVLLDRELTQAILCNPAVERLITITGINVTVAAGVVAAIDDIRRFCLGAEARQLSWPQSAGSPVGSWSCAVRSHQQGGAQPRPRMLVKRLGQPPRRPVSRTAPSPAPDRRPTGSTPRRSRPPGSLRSAPFPSSCGLPETAGSNCPAPTSDAQLQ
jgi:hypothetical protein